MPRTVEYVECRTIGHAWDPTTTESGWTLTLLCVRCTTKRHDKIGAGGVLVDRRYKHPRDYKLARGDTPVKDDLRVMLMRSIRNGDVRHFRRR